MNTLKTESLTARCGAELQVWTFPDERMVSIDIADGSEVCSAHLSAEMAELHILHVRRAIDALRSDSVVSFRKIVPGAARSATL